MPVGISTPHMGPRMFCNKIYSAAPFRHVYPASSVPYAHEGSGAYVFVATKID